ncbi:GNAT family N-acetyltransferase [Flavobacterium wongokense]|uniref:GNAT family N-acetyltransferase n=1 Tax=Flavobacterium wongokense TaxID=2910674 RepID=UPI001F3C812F|nr:GNAT family N-acetyltransferase [Flavobacterium sp. WG47]MCF6131981.1 GNAT family N-acetyltransferase [Flavobacterium sp. WG47]
MNLILETERLILRPLELSDVDGFFAMNDNPNVSKYLRIPLKTRGEAEAYIRKIINEYQKNGIGRFAVVLKNTNNLIGFSGLKLRANAENGYENVYDLGYRFAEEHWHQGFATEAAQAWLKYGFNEMKLSVIHACAVKDNIGSNKVLQKLGFEFTNEYMANNEPHNWYKIEKHNLK